MSAVAALILASLFLTFGKAGWYAAATELEIPKAT
jgi:hypothetical protein